MKTLCLFFVFFLWVSSAYAFSFEEGSGEKTMTIEDYIQDYVDIPEGAIDWKLFGTTEEVLVNTKTDDGYDLTYSKPKFREEIKALDGQEIKIKGYMFPLDETEDQKLFLFGPFPLSCPFRYHVGPPLVIEVHANDNPVEFDYEPIVISGILELVPQDQEYSIFYRLKNTRQIK